mmetsp:Transcript_104213/g.271358  ORF Transcript_104213/g.271358 Transcript_104213/m.271358 type:complete len:606 (+) Transcript_104213:70-1887(+)
MHSSRHLRLPCHLLHHRVWGPGDFFQYRASGGDDLVDKVGPRELVQVVDGDDVLMLGQGCQVLHHLNGGVRADWHPDDAGLLLQLGRRRNRAHVAQRLTVRDHQHDGGGVFAAVDELGLRRGQGHRGQGRGIRELEVRDQLGRLKGVVRHVLDPGDLAVLLYVRGSGARGADAPGVGVPRRGAAEDLQRYLDLVVAAHEVRDQVADHLQRLLPACRSEAATAVHEDDEIDLRAALEELAFGRGVVELGARLVVAIPELQAGLADGRRALARAPGGLVDDPVAPLAALPASLRAAAPIAPVLELAILVAGLGVAALGLLGVLAGLTPVLHFHEHRPHALADTAAAVGGAGGPALPLADCAVDGARVGVAALLQLEWRAGHAGVRVHQDAAALREDAAAAGDGALGLLPIRHLAVRNHDLPTLLLVELATDLLERADLGLEDVLLVAALLHGGAILGRDLGVLLCLEVRRGLGIHLVLRRGGEIGGRYAQLLSEVRELRLHDRLVPKAARLQRLEVGLQRVQHVLDARLDVQEPVADLHAAALAQGALVGGDAVVGNGSLGHYGDVQRLAVVAHGINHLRVLWILAVATEAAILNHQGDLVTNLVLR